MGDEGFRNEHFFAPYKSCELSNTQIETEVEEIETGCYGHPEDVTPHLDALAARGTRFANAYTNSPICVPALAALATGRYVHQIGCWDNAHAYPGAAGFRPGHNSRHGN